MAHPDLITASIWNDANVDQLRTMWLDGASAGEIAHALGQGITRNSVIGKVTRMKLTRRDKASRTRPSTVYLKTHVASVPTGKRGRAGSPGQTSAKNIIAKRDRIAEARTHANLAVIGRTPFREGTLPIDDEGVDVTHLIGFKDRRIGRECAFIPGDPAGGAMCCGRPVQEGSEWCPEHWARVYPTRATR